MLHVSNLTSSHVKVGPGYFRLQNLFGEEFGVFKEASIVYPEFGKNYTDQYLNAPVGKGVEETRNIIMSENYTENCMTYPQQDRMNISFPWFNVSVFYRLFG